MIFKSLILEPVKFGSNEHLLPIVIALVLGLAIVSISNYKLNAQQAKLIFFFLGFSISLTVIVYHIYKIVEGDYNFNTDLPLFICSFMALIIPIFTYYRKYWMYEILFFWVIGGTTQGIITPDIPEGFPSFDYFRYWVVHMGLLIIIAYATVVFKMRPRFVSIFKSLFILQIYIIIMLGLNTLLGANYSYLSHKPHSASLLDYFHKWPYYIIEIELIVVPYLLLIYLPFHFINKREKIKRQ